MKKCARCKVEKDLNQFHRSSKAKDGYASRCKQCVDYNYRLKRYGDPYAIRPKNGRPRIDCAVQDCDIRRCGQNAQYCSTHQWRFEHHGDPLWESKSKPHVCVRCSLEKPIEEFCKHPTGRDGVTTVCKECKKAYDGQYRNQNITKRRQSHAKRRAILRGIDAEDISFQDIWNRDGHVCKLCNKIIDPSLKYPNPNMPSLDHVIPLSLGGRHTFDNVRLTHLHCNIKRGAARGENMSHYKLGKLAAVLPDGLKYHTEYLGSNAPLPEPAEVHYAGTIANNAWGMFLNDSLGDCTQAGVAHLIMAFNAEVSESDPIPTDEAVRTEYFNETGGQDSGCVEASVLGKWRKTGLYGSKLAGYAPVRLDVNSLKQAIAAYGHLYIGIACPASMQEQFGAGETITWDSGSPIEGGHAVDLIGYNANTVDLLTWGSRVQATWEFVLNVIDEAWVVIPEQFVEAGRGPEIDLAALQADLGKLG